MGDSSSLAPLIGMECIVGRKSDTMQHLDEFEFSTKNETPLALSSACD